MMQVSNKGIELIKEFEGFSNQAYRCSANKLTIGYGHVIKDDEKELMTKNITQREGEILLREDIKRFEDYLNEVIEENKISLNQN